MWGRKINLDEPPYGWNNDIKTSLQEFLKEFPLQSHIYQREVNMRFHLEHIALAAVLTFGLAGCGGGSEPSEAQMKDAMDYAMNHPPGIVNSEPITIKFFKKEACDKPTPQGFHCTFDIQVVSRNIGASMYNNISMGEFYKDKDSGKWAMRPPF
jgi:hypothetical protein